MPQLISSSPIANRTLAGSIFLKSLHSATVADRRYSLHNPLRDRTATGESSGGDHV